MGDKERSSGVVVYGEADLSGVVVEASINPEPRALRVIFRGIREITNRELDLKTKFGAEMEFLRSEAEILSAFHQFVPSPVWGKQARITMAGNAELFALWQKYLDLDALQAKGKLIDPTDLGKWRGLAWAFRKKSHLAQLMPDGSQKDLRLRYRRHPSL